MGAGADLRLSKAGENIIRSPTRNTYVQHVVDALHAGGRFLCTSSVRSCSLNLHTFCPLQTCKLTSIVLIAQQRIEGNGNNIVERWRLFFLSNETSQPTSVGRWHGRAEPRFHFCKIYLWRDGASTTCHYSEIITEPGYLYTKFSC